MKAGWNPIINVGASSDAIKALESFKTGLQDAISEVERLVNIAKTVANLILKFYFELDNLEAEVLKAAIATLRDTIKDLTESVGAYFLLVPMRVVDPYAWTGDPETFYLKNEDAKQFPFLETLSGPSHINQPEDGSAGNYGFYAQIYESLRDQLDIMRPEFDDDAHVASYVLLFGADTFMELVVLAKKLERLFKLPGINLDNAVIPTPRGLTAKIVPTPLTGGSVLKQYDSGDGDFTTKPFSVRLDWEAEDKDWVLTAYGNARFQIREFIVNRWEEGSNSYNRNNIIAKIAQGDDAETRILKEEYDRLGLCIDTDIETGKVYWYSVGYLIDVLDDDGNVTQALPYPLDVATVRVAVPDSIKIAPRSGIPPDWFALPLFKSVPALDQTVGWILNWLDTLEKSITTGKDDLEDYIRFLERQVDRYSRLILDITGSISEIVDALTWPNVYAGLWAMTPGKGGNDYFLKQLAQALFNSDDGPPFEKGTEAVTGVVVYMGSETAGNIQKFVKSFELLFGSFTAETENALKTAADSMRALDADLDRQICLTQGLIRKECETTEETPPAIGKDLQPSNESGECEDTGTGAIEET